MGNRDEEQEFEHPSYVMVGLFRSEGNIGRLFGSALDKHHTSITLRVAQATRKHSLGRDWYHAKSLLPLIEVELSAAQFAEMITSMNVGSGVPGTLRSLNGERTGPVPEEHSLEVEEVRKQFARDVASVAKGVEDMEKRVADLLDKKSLSKEDKKEILSQFASFRQHVRSNSPFMVEQFERAAEKVVTHAKAEVDAFITHNVVAEGIRSLAEKAAVRAPELPAHGGPDQEGPGQ